MHNLTNNNVFTDPVQVLDDGDPVAASESQPTAQALANRTFYTNSLLAQAIGMDSTASSGTPLTLNAASNERQYFSGTSNQTINLPSETTIPQGKSFFIFWNSTGIATVKDSGGATILTIPGRLTSGHYLMAIVSSVSNATPTGNWKYFFEQPGHEQGVVDGSLAAAGEIGEVITASISNSSGITSGTTNLSRTLNITAGAWRAGFHCGYSFRGAVDTSPQLFLTLTKTSGGGTGFLPDAFGQAGLVFGGGGGADVNIGSGNADIHLTCPAYSFSINSTINYTFQTTLIAGASGGSWGAGGWLWLERCR